jgi:outer membrane autotransporter protein
MRVTRGGIILAGLILFAAPAAEAQTAADDCSSLTTGAIGASDDQGVSGCLAPITDRASLIAITNTVSRVVAGELLGEREPVAEPAGLILTDPNDVRQRLSGRGTFAVTPAADVTAPVPQRKWNAWADGKYSWINGQDAISNSDGPLINITGGIDYRITDRFVFGLLALYESSNLKTPETVGTKAEGAGGGAYLGLTVTDHIVFSALVNGTFFDNDYDLLVSTASTDSSRVQASGGFTGYYYPAASLRWSPSVTVAWSGEWLDSYTDSIGDRFENQKVETAILSVGNQLAKTIAFSDGTWVEPWAGAILEYTFLNQTETDELPTFNYSDTVDVRLQAGLNLSLAANVQLAVTGEVAGLLLNASDTYAGEANLAIQF